MPAKKEISLLPDEENSNLLAARVLRWATTIGRYVLVFTELIVISAFISRIWLDRKNSDLSEVVRQQTAILESTSDFEKQYNLLQQRLNVIQDFYKNQPNFSPGMNALVESTPPEIVYNSLSISKDPATSLPAANLVLTAYQEDSIVNFITNLLLNPNFSSISVNSIEKKPKDSKYSVSISLIFKAPSGNAVN